MPVRDLIIDPMIKGKGGAPANPAWKDWFEKQGKGEVG